MQGLEPQAVSKRSAATILAIGLVALSCAAWRGVEAARRLAVPAPAAARCLDIPRLGEGPLRSAIVAAQQRVGEAESDAARWSAAGQAWVRAARTAPNPAFYGNVAECAAQALARAPRNAEALGLRALALLDAHRFREARNSLHDALRVAPDDPALLGLLSDAELELGELGTALDAAQRMLDLKPTLLSYGRAAHLRFMQGDSVAAKRLYGLAISAGAAMADPEPLAYMITQAALVFLHEGDASGADAGFDLALQQVPEYAAALQGKGRVALARRDGRGALAWLERARAQSPLLETTWLIADAHALAGDWVAAKAAREQLLAEGARDPRTLAAFLAERGLRTDEAVRLARAELAERADPFTQSVLAFALFRSGALTEAKHLADASLAWGTRDARLLARAGVIARACGDRTRGDELLAQAARLEPHITPLFMPTEETRGDATAQLSL